MAASSRHGETNFAGDSAKPNTAPYAFAAPFSQNSFKKNFEKEIRCPPKVRSNQKRQDERSDAAKPAARAVWHGQGLQQCMNAQFPLLIGFVLLPYSIE